MTRMIIIPGEPKGKGRPRFSRASGRAYTPADTLSYEAKVGSLWMEKYADTAPLDGPLRMDIQAVFQIPRSWSKKKQAASIGDLCEKRPDADNILKAVCDGLNGLAFKDDCQVAEVHFVKQWGEVPRVQVWIRERNEEV